MCAARRCGRAPVAEASLSFKDSRYRGIGDRIPSVHCASQLGRAFVLSGDMTEAKLPTRISSALERRRPRSPILTQAGGIRQAEVIAGSEAA